MAETTELKKSDFYFDLPQELIAQDPLEDRSSSRLLVLDKNTGELSHHIFRDIIDYLHPGDCLVLNNTKVIPARLLGEREGTGGHVEVLLLKRKEADVWETLVKPGKKCKPGQRLSFGDGLLKAAVLETVEEGNRLIRVEYEGIFDEIKTVIRPFMQNMRALRQRLRRDSILPGNCCSRSRTRALRSLM